jgi:hypothetical protein
MHVNKKEKKKVAKKEKKVIIIVVALYILVINNICPINRVHHIREQNKTPDKNRGL